MTQKRRFLLDKHWVIPYSFLLRSVEVYFEKRCPLKTLAYCTALLGLSMSLCFGAATGPQYPAPGGSTLAVSGSGCPLNCDSGSGDGLTYSFSGFSPSAYGSLWWGPTNNTTDSPFLGYPAGIIGPAGTPMVFSGLNTTTITGWTYSSAYVWTSTTGWSFTSFGDSTDLSTRFLLAFDGGADPTDKGTAGIASAQPTEEVAQVVGNFSGSFVFQVLDPYNNTWEGVDNYYNSLSGTSGGVSTSADFGFWSTPSAAPEPRLYGFVLAGMIGLALFFRRRFSQIPR